MSDCTHPENRRFRLWAGNSYGVRNTTNRCEACQADLPLSEETSFVARPEMTTIIPDDLRGRLGATLAALNALKADFAAQGLHLNIDRDRYDADDPTTGAFRGRVTLNDYVDGAE